MPSTSDRQKLVFKCPGYLTPQREKSEAGAPHCFRSSPVGLTSGSLQW